MNTELQKTLLECMRGAWIIEADSLKATIATYGADFTEETRLLSQARLATLEHCLSDLIKIIGE